MLTKFGVRFLYWAVCTQCTFSDAVVRRNIIILCFYLCMSPVGHLPLRVFPPKPCMHFRYLTRVLQTPSSLLTDLIIRIFGKEIKLLIM